MTNKIKQILQISIIISALGICMIGCTPVTGTPNTYTTPTIEQPTQQEYVWRFIAYGDTYELIIETLDKTTRTGTWRSGPIIQKDKELKYFELTDSSVLGPLTDFRQNDEHGNYLCVYSIVSTAYIDNAYYTGMRQVFEQLLK